MAHLRRRIPEVLRLLRSSARLMLEMEELWPAMRRVSATETLVLEELARIRSGMRRRLRVTDLRAAYLRAKGQMPSIKVPSRFSLWWEQVALFRASQICDSRRDLARFWIRTRWLPGHGRMEALLRRVDQIALNGYRGTAIGVCVSDGVVRSRSGPFPLQNRPCAPWNHANEHRPWLRRLSIGHGDLELRDRLSARYQSGKVNIVLNLKDVSHFDSTGLVVFGLARLRKAGGAGAGKLNRSHLEVVRR